ncbi:unnamed protein product [Rotaria sordida]|uniref:Non-specific serine/threonine protein kinase n=1 Tax=Rotaria sordida TaxID=392033 RepID=A0A815P6Z3_9BILA|nr:unnamed protein product [Rotaria sordida]CAF4058434.1 unnamed protein product [Rotaria sordida]
MPMVGYILGLDDCHASNLMLDRTSEKVVHIDFGKAMEVTGIDGTFRMPYEYVMDVLRENRDSLMAVLEAYSTTISKTSSRLPETGKQQHYQSHLSTINEEDNEHESTVGEKNATTTYSRTRSNNTSTQVELLIQQATSHENLCQLDIGWCPF